jgi:hypothetical protein
MLAYGWHGGRTQAWYKSIHFSVWGWHGGSDVLIAPSILAYGWHVSRVKQWYKSIHFGEWVAWRLRARMAYVHPFWRMVWHGGCVQEWYKTIYFGVRGGMEVVMLLLLRPFWRMGGMAVACKD